MHDKEFLEGVLLIIATLQMSLSHLEAAVRERVLEQPPSQQPAVQLRVLAQRD